MAGRTGRPAWRRWLAVGVVVGGTPLGACGSAGGEPTAPVLSLPGDSLVAFVGVRVVPMDVEGVLEDRTVLVRDGVIAEVSGADAQLPEGARVVRGDGAFLLPGLIDMHVHLDRGDLEAYVRHGVTTVRNMWGFPDVRAMQAEIAAGALVGPTIHSVSPGIDGPPARWPVTQLITDPARADSMARAQRDAGWRTLKLYQDLSPQVYDSLVAAAARRGLAFVGHVPSQVPVERVVEAGQRSIEHLGGYQAIPDGERLDALVQATAAAGTWNCPTIAVQEALGNPRVARLRELVARLHAAGAPLLVGTDSGIDATVPGASIHDELAHFVAAGLTPYEALRGATVDAARFLEVETTVGAVRPGMRADLVLVRGDPLEDVGALRDRVGVMLGGEWLAAR